VETAMEAEEIINENNVPERKRRRTLRYSVWDGCFYSLRVGAAETYFIPMMVAFGAGAFYVGVYTALPQLFVAFAQFASLFLVERYMVRKRIMVGLAIMQVLVVGSIFLMVSGGWFNPWLFIAIACAYFGFNGMTLPPWNSLMGDITTKADRGVYFGKRNGLMQLVTFLSILAGGVVLQHFSSAGGRQTGFSILIAIALAGTFGSAYSLIRHYEVPYRQPRDAGFTFGDFIRRSPRSNFAHFVFFISLINFATQISSPFFPVYMLRDLKLNYAQYMLSQGIFIAAQFLAMRRWGPFSDRYGNRIVLRITGAFLPVLPMLWFFSTKLEYIVVIQVISGLTWGGWLLSSGNFIFDAVTPANRARCAAYLNFFNGIGICLGALIGAFLSERIPSSFSLGTLSFSFLSPLETIFLISGLLRFAVIFLFNPLVHEVRDVRKPNFKEVFVTLMHIKPLSGGILYFFTGVDHEKNGAGKGKENGEED